MGLNSQDIARLGPRAQKQLLQKLGAQQRQRQSKYNNEPTTVNGIKFDSRKEARRYEELMVMQRAGEIKNLRLQAQYTLQESFITPEGTRIRAIKYVADFAYDRRNKPSRNQPDLNEPIYWTHVVEDVKSRATKTPQYEIKKKLMYEKFRIEIREV
ncbi:MAG: DUF1064 domain-containing protein [Oscillospiraceae bacterium]|nr:DUF1064 domain-containing protein [Oscillospiraceae bacterium]